MKRSRLVFLITALGGLALLAACGPGTTPTPLIVRETVEVPVGAPESSVKVPFLQLWEGSAHADASAEPFNHWNEEDPAEIPPACAKCHSTPGFEDYLGLDGSTVGQVDAPAPIGTVITCEACHNDATLSLTSVVMPSGAELTGLGPEARCMQCHQGRESTDTVNAKLEAAGVGEDTTSADLGFINIHYFAAAATLYGNEARGGYQYEGHAYSGKFNHVEAFDTCIECHNPHTLEVQVDACAGCHSGVASVEDLRNVRMNGSLVDYDGDGDIQEGIYFEIDGLREKLLEGIQAYAREVNGTAIAYSPDAYPYFFIDTNGNGALDEDEASFPNAYNAWTPRLLKAAYNYQTSLKDPGAFAHNAKYVIQLLYDSIDTLNEKLAQPVDLTTAHRNDPGHFDGTAEAFRHWDAEGIVPGTCSKCHSGYGLPFYLGEAVTVSQSPTNGLLCITCHDSVPEFTRRVVEDVQFPSGAIVSFDETDPNLCINCHQGRESTVSVNAAIARAGVGDDAVSDQISFRNPHYFAAGGTLFGSEVSGAYQYEGKDYRARLTHVDRFNTCTECHDTHGLEVRVEACSGCHNGITDAESLRTIRMESSAGIDYDGDGDAEEGIGEEVATEQEMLLQAIMDYAAATAGTPIVYQPTAYPYYFIDTNGDGVADPDEMVSANSFKSWTPRMLRAAYNYQWVAKDPGAFAHNGKYILQILYDSLQDLGVNVGGMTRP